MALAPRGESLQQEREEERTNRTKPWESGLIPALHACGRAKKQAQALCGSSVHLLKGGGRVETGRGFGREAHEPSRSLDEEQNLIKKGEN